MELTLKRLLEHAEFKKYRGKGYDPTEVDDFLDRAAAMAGKVEVQLTQALEAAKSAGGGAPAEPDPAVIEAEVERRVAERLAASEAARPSVEDEAEQSSRILLMAQRTADETVKAANDEAAQLLADAQERAAAMVAEATERAEAARAEADQLLETTRAEVEAEAARERREARQRLAAEIGELEGVREVLRSDVNVLERHVEEQRSQLGSTLAELQQILDDPSGFRMAPPPALVDPELPDFSDLAEEPAADPAGDAPTQDDGASAPAPEAEPQAEAPAAVEPEAAPEAPQADVRLTDEPEAPNGFDREPSPQALDFGDVDHDEPGFPEPTEGGPPTAPVAAVDLGGAAPDPDPASDDPRSDDDPFLAELRKAMADDEPLGPRDHEGQQSTDTLFDDEDRRGWRFGRRR